MITKTEVLRLGFSIDGSPFCKVGSAGTNPNHLGFSIDASPWWGHSGGETTTIIRTGNIKRVAKVDWGEIKTVSEVEGW